MDKLDSLQILVDQTAIDASLVSQPVTPIMQMKHAIFSGQALDFDLVQLTVLIVLVFDFYEQ